MSLLQAKKFLLVDANQLNPGNNESSFLERSKPLPTKELQSLDKSMLQIINNSMLSTDDKVQAYNRVLSEYQSMTSYPTINSDTFNEPSNNIQEEPIYDPLISITSQYKNKAANLLSLLKKSNKIKVLPNGQVSIKGNTIAQSNISDMLNKAVNSRANKRDIPGWDEFEQLIEEENIPRFLLNNRYTSASSVSAKPVSIRPRRTIPVKSVYNDWESHDEPKNKKRTAITKKKKKISK